jgi:hypothetical protein
MPSGHAALVSRPAIGRQPDTGRVLAAYYDAHAFTDWHCIAVICLDRKALHEGGTATARVAVGSLAGIQVHSEKILLAINDLGKSN